MKLGDLEFHILNDGTFRPRRRRDVRRHSHADVGTRGACRTIAIASALRMNSLLIRAAES